jgi:hypothetical protein
MTALYNARVASRRWQGAEKGEMKFTGGDRVESVPFFSTLPAAMDLARKTQGEN